MQELHNHSNIRSIEHENQHINIFEAHRYSTLVHFYAYKEGLIDLDDPPMLVLFDGHDDCEAPKLPNVLKNIDIKTVSEREFSTFVNFDMNWNDSDWIFTSMELGLISDLVIIGGDSTGRGYGHSIYTSMKGTTHNIWKINQLWNALDSRGDLVDHIKSHMEPLWEALGWTGRDFDPDQGKPIIVDIDLDFMTINTAEVLTSIPYEIFKHIWTKPLHRGVTCKHFFEDLLERTELICIAMESDYTGSIVNSWENLLVIDAVMFSNSLPLRRNFT